jgi:hypothetical protein
MNKEVKEYEIEYTEQFIEDIQAHKKAGQKSTLLEIRANASNFYC